MRMQRPGSVGASGTLWAVSLVLVVAAYLVGLIGSPSTADHKEPDGKKPRQHQRTLTPGKSDTAKPGGKQKTPAASDPGPKPKTYKIDYLGGTRVLGSGRLFFKAQLTGKKAGKGAERAPVKGKTVTFVVQAGQRRLDCTDITGTQGVAECTPLELLPGPAKNFQVTVTIKEDPTFTPDPKPLNDIGREAAGEVPGQR